MSDVVFDAARRNAVGHGRRHGAHSAGGHRRQALRPQDVWLADLGLAEHPLHARARVQANLKMAQDNFEGNLCLAATGSVNEDVIETAICDGNDKYQAWQLKVIEELPQHLDDEYGGH